MSTLPEGTIPAGKGAFSLTLSDAGRTILPATPNLNDFAVYNLNFTPTNNGEAMNVDRTNETLPTDPILLDPGTYNLVVNAYKDNNKTQLAARGILDNVTITAGENTSATVTLKALLSDGTGTFKWDIILPNDVTTDMTITPGNESGTQQQTVTLTPPQASGSRTLNSGPYSIIFNLENTDGKTVEWKELLYVYQNLESVFSFEFTDAHLIDSIYTVTFDSNGGEPGEWQQSVLHGNKVPTPTAPIKSQYAFIGWYTDNDTFANVWDFNNPVIESFTLYAKWLSTAVPGATLADKLSWVQTNSVSGRSYFLEVDADESIEPHTLSYSGRSNITINLIGIDSNWIISLSSNGSMFSVGSGVTLVLDNNITLQGRSDNTNSLVSVNSGGTLVMNMGSTVTGNTSSYYGGGVSVGENGTFTMNGGEISGNTASSSGGGVYVGGGTFTMNGGEISGNTASSSGGGVYVDIYYEGNAYRGGTFTMTGGTVYGSNETGYDANNVPLANTSAYRGAALYVNSGTTTYGDGSNILPHTDGHTAYTNNTITGGSRNDVALSGSGTEQNPWLVSNAGEWISARANIIATTGNYFIRITGNFNMTGDGAPTFGNTPDGSTLTVTISGDRTISLEAGSQGSLLRIDNNQTVIMQDVDLKGHADNTTSLIYIYGGNFTMQGNASVSGNTTTTSSYYLYGGGGVYVVSNGTFTMNNGEISGNTASYGGGVYVGSNTTFTMNGGEISGNTASSYGGGVYVWDGTFIMNGGEISGNTSYGSGGGVCVARGTFTMSGGTVYGSNETGQDANNIPLANTANTGAALYAYGTAKYGDNSNILPHTDGHSAYTNNTVTGGSRNDIALSGSGTEQNPWLVSNAGEWNRARANIIAATGNYFIRITGNFNMTTGDEDNAPTFGYTSDGSTLTVTMSGDRTISLEAGSSDNLLIIGNRQTVIMQDVDLEGHADNTTSLIYVEYDGCFTMQGNASVSGNGGRGVHVHGTFTMSGGEISGNTSSYGSGGGVYVSSYYDGNAYRGGTFTMTGGEISDNTSFYGGGGVYVTNDGTFTMTGGEISGNTTSYGGGGVYVTDDGTFTMTGGEISGNTSYYGGGGGGVYVTNDGTFTMSGGEISGNTATITSSSSSSGGGVYVANNGTFTKTGGTIYGYSAIDVNSNVVKDSSGTVLNDRGHAVYVYVSSTTNRRRETTAGPSVNLDSTIAGAEGGWED